MDMDQVMDTVKLNKFNFLKKTDEFTQQSKNVNHENRRIEDAVQILNVVMFVNVIALYSLSISKDKIDQVTSVVLIKLPKKDIESLWCGGVKARLINVRSSSYLYSKKQPDFLKKKPRNITRLSLDFCLTYYVHNSL